MSFFGILKQNNRKPLKNSIELDFYQLKIKKHELQKLIFENQELITLIECFKGISSISNEIKIVNNQNFKESQKFKSFIYFCLNEQLKYKSLLVSIQESKSVFNNQINILYRAIENFDEENLEFRIKNNKIFLLKNLLSEKQSLIENLQNNLKSYLTNRKTSEILKNQEFHDINQDFVNDSIEKTLKSENEKIDKLMIQLNIEKIRAEKLNLQKKDLNSRINFVKQNKYFGEKEQDFGSPLNYNTSASSSNYRNALPKQEISHEEIKSLIIKRKLKKIKKLREILLNNQKLIQNLEEQNNQVIRENLKLKIEKRSINKAVIDKTQTIVNLQKKFELGK